MEEMHNFCLQNMMGDLGGEWTDIKMDLRLSGMQGYGRHLYDVG
jgi:hypothetical protein